MEKTLQILTEEIPWYIGVVVCGILVFKLLISLYPLLCRKQFAWLVDGGKWAVVTGATDGIGYEFAVQLAEKGYNLMLLSRNEEKLQRTKQNILHNSEISNIEIQIETLAVDFSTLDIYDQIKQFLRANDRDIFVLVNNVGVGVPYPDTFLNIMEKEPKLNERMINVNIVSATKMTELVLPSMVARKRGLILNVSSYASFFPNPLISVYSATKAFMRHFSIGLAEEYRRDNILIFCINPGMVSTNMTNNIQSAFVPSAKTYVKSVLNKVQNMNNFETTGHWIHQLLKYIGNTSEFLLPAQLFYRFLYYVVAKHTDEAKKQWIISQQQSQQQNNNNKN